MAADSTEAVGIRAAPWAHAPTLGLARGAVWEVVLSAPLRLNAMSRSMWRQLRCEMETIALQPGLRAVVLRGQGEHFCSGGDISEYPSFRFAKDSLQEFHEQTVWGALRSLLECPVPVVAMIDGYCMGGGLELACCCDIRLATTRSTFGAPIGKLGFPMAPKELQLLLTHLGHSFASAMLMAGQIFTADRLLQHGFLMDSVSVETSQSRLIALVDKIAQSAPQAMRMNKLNALRWIDLSLSSQLDGQSAYDYADSDEHREGVQAFLLKRRPQWQ